MSDFAMTQLNTAQLATLIDQKHACLAQLRDLGPRQQELIEAGDLTQLLRLLASKQHLISVLQRIEHDLTPFRAEDPDTRAWRTPECRAKCAAQAAACERLLEEIVRQEKANEALMAERRHAVADRLNQVHAQARASGAYRKQSRLVQRHPLNAPSTP